MPCRPWFPSWHAYSKIPSSLNVIGNRTVHGFAHVGYISDQRIIGISKLTRVVRMFSRRFTVQERLGEQIADAIAELIEPRGVGVYLEAMHLCTQMRGVREEHSKTVMTFWRGDYVDDTALRREFLAEAHRRSPWT